MQTLDEKKERFKVVRDLGTHTRNKPVSLLTDQEIETVFAALSPNVVKDVETSCILMVALHLAARVNEILNLRVDDIVESGGRITNVIFRKRKNGKPHTMPCPNVLHLSLSNWKRIRQEKLNEYGIKNCEWLFINVRKPHGDHKAVGTKIAYSTLGMTLKRLQERCKLNKTIRMHSWRHLSICRFLKNCNNDIKLSMTFSNHSSLNSFNYYLHASDEDLLENMESLANGGKANEEKQQRRNALEEKLDSLLGMAAEIKLEMEKDL